MIYDLPSNHLRPGVKPKRDDFCDYEAKESEVFNSQAYNAALSAWQSASIPCDESCRVVWKYLDGKEVPEGMYEAKRCNCNPGKDKCPFGGDPSEFCIIAYPVTQQPGTGNEVTELTSDQAKEMFDKGEISLMDAVLQHTRIKPAGQGVTYDEGEVYILLNKAVNHYMDLEEGSRSPLIEWWRQNKKPSHPTTPVQEDRAADIDKELGVVIDFLRPQMANGNNIATCVGILHNIRMCLPQHPSQSLEDAATAYAMKKIGYRTLDNHDEWDCAKEVFEIIAKSPEVAAYLYPKLVKENEELRKQLNK